MIGYSKVAHGKKPPNMGLRRINLARMTVKGKVDSKTRSDGHGNET